VETQTQTFTKKRGGAKQSGGHIALMILSTLLLTVAGLLFISHSSVTNILGVIALLAGLLVRVIDTRI